MHSLCQLVNVWWSSGFVLNHRDCTNLVKLVSISLLVLFLSGCLVIDLSQVFKLILSIERGFLCVWFAQVPKQSNEPFSHPQHSPAHPNVAAGNKKKIKKKRLLGWFRQSAPLKKINKKKTSWKAAGNTRTLHECPPPHTSESSLHHFLFVSLLATRW